MRYRKFLRAKKKVTARGFFITRTRGIFIIGYLDFKSNDPGVTFEEKGEKKSVTDGRRWALPTPVTRPGHNPADFGGTA